MDEATSEKAVEAENEIEASGDTVVLADAIYGGFALLAGAVRELAKAMNGEPGEPQNDEEFYLDGSKR